MGTAFLAGYQRAQIPGGKAALMLLLMVSWAACRQPTPPAPEVVTSLQALQQLATVSCEVSKVIKANDNADWYKIGDRKILITCQATIKAGIDMQAIQKDQISISGKSIRLKLPPPAIISVNLPPGNIKVAYSDIGLFRSDFTGAEIDQLLAQAEKQMWASGASLGIMEQAKVNTQLTVSDLLHQLGFETVDISFDAPTSPTKFVP